MKHERARVDVRQLRAVFVHNPTSGKASTRGHRRDRVERFIRENRLNAALALTEYRGHATELARAAVEAGADLVVSVGGDGTMNEVASGVVGSPVLYGMIPTGSGNGLARDLGLPMDFDAALDVLLDGAVRVIDTGAAAGYPFFNVMGFGFDAEIGRRFNTTRRRGFLNYVQLGLRTFFGYRRQSLTVTPDGAPVLSVDAFVASVANSTQYGNNARIAPCAQLDDGQLDFVAVTTGNPILAVPLVVRLFSRSLHRSRFARSAVASRFQIRRPSPGPIHTDGEIHDAPADFEVVVRPRSLRVVVPPSLAPRHDDVQR